MYSESEQYVTHWLYLSHNPKLTANKSASNNLSMLVPVLVQLSKAHFHWLKSYWGHKTPIQTAKYTMASWLKSTVLIKKTTQHVSDQHFAITEFKFHCIAVFLGFVCFFLLFFFLPYHWSSWTVYVQQWDWLKGFLLLGTNYDRVLILWPKLAASSNTVSEKWRQQRFNRTFALHL